MNNLAMSLMKANLKKKKPKMPMEREKGESKMNDPDSKIEGKEKFKGKY